jgi:transposase
MDTLQQNAWVGIDIAKLTLEACLLRSQGKPQHKSFPNTQDGFAKLIRWLEHLAPQGPYHFCMEATGAYYEALAVFLAEANYPVSVINPFRARHAALAQGATNKTDPAEAATLAEYCRQQNPPLWRRAAPEVRILVGLLRRLQTLKDTLAQEHNRLSEPGMIVEVQASLNKSVAFLQEQITAVQEQIQTHIDQHPNLKADQDLLTSIPGVGELTAAWLMAELGDVAQFASAEAAAAYAGLAPCQYRSGTSVRRQTHLSKRGNARLRRALYMPALTGARFNPLLKALYERLLARGKARLVAIGAVMRKLLMIAYGVLKHRTEFTAQPVPKTA